MAEDGDTKNLESRPPVVTVVGHVDHGKTTLLDFIRKTTVATGEAGGITQSIGAYEIEHPVKDSSSPTGQATKKITFIDTPGHEAFSAMRAHGAKIADIAVLVVAADEGVKAQTTEAIDVLKKTDTPFVVAITKIDKPNADTERVKNELVSAGVLLEGMGGDVSWHAVSGKTGEGVDDILSLIILAGEVAGLSYNSESHATGFILETEKDQRRGALAHIVLKDGILKQGEDIVTPSVSGKIKILENFLGERVEELKPSSPAVICGFEDLPKSGEQFWAGEADLEVIGLVDRDGAIKKLSEEAETILGTSGGLEEKEIKKKRIKVVLKADTNGSLDALKKIVGEKTEVVSSSVGEVSDNDVKFARSTESIIVGFNVSAGKAVRKLAEAQDVKIITSEVIYKLLEEVELVEKTEKQQFKGGMLEVLAIFSTSVSKQTIGGKVIEGAMRAGWRVEIEREDEIIGKGKIRSLQVNKEDVKEATEGNETGLVIETSVSIKEGDYIKIEE